jgi:AcrR family transcriptional regulator
MDVTRNTPLAEQQAGLSLRERKKLRTRVAIRRATYRLIVEQGYEATTIEQIAEAAEVSPSTVFRYFPVKEDIVLTDEYDPVMADALRERPQGEPFLDSLRAVMVSGLREMMRDEHDEVTQRSKLMVEVPAIRARMAETMSETAQLLTGILAERTGRDPDDLELRVFTAGVLGAFSEVTLYWAEHDFEDDLFSLMDRAVGTLKGMSGEQKGRPGA